MRSCAMRFCRRSPRPHYVVTLPAKIGAALKRLLPASMLYRLLARQRLNERRTGTDMATVFNILAILVMAAVVIVLVRGLINMMRGGYGKTSNKLMQARVLLQFVAIVLILLACISPAGG